MVRPASFEDISQLVALGKKFHAEAGLDKGIPYNPVSTGFFLRAMIEAETCGVFVTEDAGRVIGAIGGTITPYAYNMDYRVMLENFWFSDPEHRNSSDAIRLVKTLIRWGIKQGVAMWIFGAFHALQFKRVRRFYERLGMQMNESLFYGRA